MEQTEEQTEIEEEVEEPKQNETQKEDWLGLDNFDFGLDEFKLDFDLGF